MSLSAAVVPSFPKFLEETDEIDSVFITMTTDHHISRDSIPVMVQTDQNHQVAIANSTPTKPVLKEPPVDPPTSNHTFVMKCDQKLNLKPTTTVTGMAFSGLLFHSTSSLLFTPHFLFL
jgi:hypothetical protein